ncbi:substrate-binding domain-containing protein [Phaeovulum sp. W22_SRMD_FR3]|jgi:ribose transport system substrate-binding protein|uniref:substrate-binding domain-containing protein n=1 Tax=Phaeovulum sp. W22_SRMD_FR3 TaxID=3240274 RepID=UPI003F9B9672
MFNKLNLIAGLLALTATGHPVGAAEFTIGVSIPAATHGWTGGLNFFAEDTIKKMEATFPDIDWVLATASDVNDQVNDLEDLAARNVDAIIVLPMESDPLTEPVKQLKQNGSFITVIDRGLAEAGIEDFYLAGNNTQYGTSAGEYFVKRFPAGAKIVVLRGLPTTIDNIRVDAFTAAIEGSGIEVLDMQYANWNPDKGFEVMQDFLQRFPQIDGVWAGDDDPALGAMEAIRQDGRKGIVVLGGGGMKDILKGIADGTNDMIDADVLYHPSLIVPAIEMTAMHFALGMPIEGTFQLDSPTVTKENAAQYYNADSPY